MAYKTIPMKLLFIINPGSGNGEINFCDVISDYFETLEHTAQLYTLTLNCSLDKVKSIITDSNADRVIAVGGDGTIKLVAECLLQTETPMGIIPAGSANGMAKELGIPVTIKESLDVTVNGQSKNTCCNCKQ
ncbi:diacylglycerol/lipid kinase family protein [Pedobacter steynii]